MGWEKWRSIGDLERLEREQFNISGGSQVCWLDWGWSPDRVNLKGGFTPFGGDSELPWMAFAPVSALTEQTGVLL